MTLHPFVQQLVENVFINQFDKYEIPSDNTIRAALMDAAYRAVSWGQNNPPESAAYIIYDAHDLEKLRRASEGLA